MLHRFVARTEDERRAVLAAVGPGWDGNEVWLIAGLGLGVTKPSWLRTAASSPAIAVSGLGAELSFTLLLAAR